MRGQLSFIAMLSLSALLLVGCQTRPGYTYRDVAPLHDDFGHARSLTITEPVVRTSLPHDRYETWYHGRRDIGPFVTAGTISLRYEESVTETRDSQRIYGDHVYDRYNETTYRRTYRSGTR